MTSPVQYLQFIVVLITTIQGRWFNNDIVKLFQGGDDWGYATNCNTRSPYNASLKWSPKTVSIQKTNMIIIDFTVTSPVKLATGKLEFSIFMPGNKDPLATKINVLRCVEMAEANPDIKCPIEVKDVFHYQYRTTAGDVLSPGRYGMKLNVTNSQEEVFACFKMEVTVTE